MAVFSSTPFAVDCAIDIQREFHRCSEDQIGYDANARHLRKRLKFNRSGNLTLLTVHSNEPQHLTVLENSYFHPISD
ncbi:hypothetical protein DXT97_21720 [Agrobacterium tumefaciens]|nr:hypothetical protein [Agrobacterium tumefaciens]